MADSRIENKRLIYAEDAKKSLTGWETDPTDEEIEYTIDNIPTVDAIPVAHGRWERNEHNKIVCSRCKNEPLLDDFGHWALSTYCPHCGLEMDGDVNEKR